MWLKRNIKVKNPPLPARNRVDWAIKGFIFYHNQFAFQSSWTHAAFWYCIFHQKLGDPAACLLGQRVDNTHVFYSPRVGLLADEPGQERKSTNGAFEGSQGKWEEHTQDSI